MKKKNLFFASIFILISGISFSQTPAWLWAKQAGGSNVDNVNSVALDASGNVYVAGWYNSWPAIFGADTIYTTGAYDLFLVKYDANGNALWARSVGGTGNPTYECDDRAYSVTTDAAGNVYLAGTFTSPFITFGTTTLTKGGTNYTDADVYLVKYDANGNVRWAKSGVGGSGVNYAYSVSADVTGHVYLVGTYASTSINFGGNTLSNGSLFLTKYDTAGNVTWARSCSGSINGPLSLAAQASGIYIAGTFYGNSITFGTTTLSHTGGLAYHMFLLKYDASGNITWAKGENGNFDDYGYSVAADASGNIYVAGAFLSNTVAFDTHVLTNTAAAPSYDSFILKYDVNGNVVWAKSIDATTGVSWPGNNDRPWALAEDASGNIYMAGSFMCTNITFGNIVLNNAGGSSGYFDVYVVKYDAGGNVLGATSAGGSSEDYAYSIAAGTSGNVYVAGSFDSPTIVFGTDTLTQVGSYEIFLAKLDGNLITGKESFINKNNIVISPDPSGGIFTVNVSSGCQYNLEIYNIMGEQVYRTSNCSPQSHNIIDLTASPKGIYFVKINDTAGVSGAKIVKQ